MLGQVRATHADMLVPANTLTHSTVLTDQDAVV